MDADCTPGARVAGRRRRGARRRRPRPGRGRGSSGRDGGALRPRHLGLRAVGAVRDGQPARAPGVVRAARGLRELAAPSAGRRDGRGRLVRMARTARRRARRLLPRGARLPHGLSARAHRVRRRARQAALLSGDGRAHPRAARRLLPPPLLLQPPLRRVRPRGRGRPCSPRRGAAPPWRRWPPHPTSQLARDSRYWGRRRAPAIAAVRVGGRRGLAGRPGDRSVRARSRFSEPTTATASRACARRRASRRASRASPRRRSRRPRSALRRAPRCSCPRSRPPASAGGRSR